MRKVGGILVILLIIAYPFLVYLGINHLSLKVIGWIFLGIIIIRSLILKNQNQQWLPIIIGVFVSTILLNVFNDPIYLKINPVFISLSVFTAFTITLFKPPSMIETFARIQDKNLPDKAIPYCRKITIIWCAFLLINSVIALYTALYTDMKTWTLYNGLISYLLMGALFAGEFLYRTFILKPNEDKNA
ncbi:MAG: hypothetical protein NE327_01060 [Lentisphaeraceae bacterium]|nr:hypothetical protein [Lentisphaeraceae bacterium]